jgi:hypothetical protein
VPDPEPHRPELVEQAFQADDVESRRLDQGRSLPSWPYVASASCSSLASSAHASGVDDLLHALKLRAHILPPRSSTSSGSLAVGSRAARSPSRWLQEIPAVCMNAPRPIRSAHSTSQVERNRPGCNLGSELS